MAVPSQQRTTPDGLIDRRYRGLTIPITKKTHGYFQSSYTRDIIRSSIWMILSTKKGERVCLPEFGTRLYELLFELNDMVTRTLARQIVIEDIERWEPRVQVGEVSILSEDRELQVYVEYAIIGTDEAATLSLSIDPSSRSVSLDNA